MAIDKNTESSATRQIDAPAAAIFDILSNPQRHAETDDSGMVVSADQGERLEKVTLVHDGALLSEGRFPADLAQRYTRMFTDHGVTVLPHHRGERVEADGDDLAVVLDDGTRLDATLVVVALGSELNTGIAREAGLEVDEDGAVVVDEYLRTSNEHVWAAGDIISYPDALLGRRRIEHIDHARKSGDAAGASMTGEDVAYEHTPYFYSQVFGNRWEAVGETSTQHETLEVPLDDGRLVVYYLDDAGKPVGVLAWKVEDAMDAARQVIADGVTDPDELRARIR